MKHYKIKDDRVVPCGCSELGACPRLDELERNIIVNIRYDQRVFRNVDNCDEVMSFYRRRFHRYNRALLSLRKLKHAMDH